MTTQNVPAGYSVVPWASLPSRFTLRAATGGKYMGVSGSNATLDTTSTMADLVVDQPSDIFSGTGATGFCRVYQFGTSTAFRQAGFVCFYNTYIANNVDFAWRFYYKTGTDMRNVILGNNYPSDGTGYFILDPGNGAMRIGTTVASSATTFYVYVAPQSPATSYITGVLSRPLTVSSGVTVSMWVNFTNYGATFSNFSTLVEVTTTSAYTNGFSIIFVPTVGFQLLLVVNGISTGVVAQFSLAQPSHGVWYHIAGKFTTAASSIFVNGVQGGQLSGVCPSLGSSTLSNVIVGACGRYSLCHALNGLVDNLQIWNADIESGYIMGLQTLPISGDSAKSLENKASQNSVTFLSTRAQVALTSEASVSLWAKFNTLSASNMVLVSFGTQVSVRANTTQRLLLNVNGTSVQPSGQSALTTSTWYHVVAIFTLSGLTSVTCTLFINGGAQVLSATVAMSNFSLGSMSIGANSIGSSAFDGLVDSVQVWERALDLSDVSTLYLSADKYPNNIQGSYFDSLQYTISTATSAVPTKSSIGSCQLVAGVTPGASNTIVVKPVNVSGASWAAATLQSPVMDNLIVGSVALTSSSISVSWVTLPSDSIDSVSYTLNGGQSTIVSTTTSPITIDGLAGNTSYAIVFTTRQNGTNVRSASTMCVTLSTVGSPSITSYGTYLALSWNTSTSSFTRFAFSLNGGAIQNVYGVPSSVGSYNIYGNSFTSLGLLAVNSIGVVSQVIPLTIGIAPAFISSFVASSSSATIVTITWDSNNSSFTSFGYTLNGGAQTNVVLSSSVGVYTITGLQSNTLYAVQLALSSGVTVSSSTTTLPVVSGFTGIPTAGSHQQITMSWSTTLSNFSSFRYFITHDVTVNANHLSGSLTVGGLSSNTTYIVYMVPVNSTGGDAAVVTTTVKTHTRITNITFNISVTVRRGTNRYTNSYYGGRNFAGVDWANIVESYSYTDSRVYYTSDTTALVNGMSSDTAYGSIRANVFGNPEMFGISLNTFAFFPYEDAILNINSVIFQSSTIS